MSLQTVRRCDVYPSVSRGVVRFFVSIQKIVVEPAGAVNGVRTPVLEKDLDLSPRALKRLLGFVEAGSSKPRAPKGGKDDAADSGATATASQVAG